MKILISTSSFGEYDSKALNNLKKNGFEIILNPHGRKLSEKELLELAKDCSGIVAGTENYTKEVLQKLPKLKVISRCGAGMDGIDLEEIKKRKIKITNTPDAPTQAVAELTIGLMFSLLRKIPEMNTEVKQGIWNKKMGNLMQGKTIGIIGLGRIGKTVAKLLKVFGITLIAVEPYPNNAWNIDNEIKVVTLDELLKRSEIITLHVPYTKENQNLINSKNMQLIKKEAYVINTSRGGLINENDLYAAIKEGKIAGAALDVMEKEPYTGKLAELNNVILTPHIGAYAIEARIKMENEAVENLIKLIKEG